jgi:hypothetical protein
VKNQELQQQWRIAHASAHSNDKNLSQATGQEVFAKMMPGNEEDLNPPWLDAENDGR